ncbi:MAG: OmpH family outer membrane protein [Bacteroidota bacterium]
MKKAGLLILLSFFLFTENIFAQQKYGHINSNDILEVMPEYKQLNATLDSKKKQYSVQLQSMYKDYEQKTKEVNDYGAAMMEAVREERLKEIEGLQNGITTFQENADAEMQKMQVKLMKPLNDKYLKIVKAVAQENGLAYVFDLASGAVVYHPESKGDVTELVKRKMGIN